jgi:hypothetical protein
MSYYNECECVLCGEAMGLCLCRQPLSTCAICYETATPVYTGRYHYFHPTL